MKQKIVMLILKWLEKSGFATTIFVARCRATGEWTKVSQSEEEVQNFISVTQSFRPMDYIEAKVVPYNLYTPID